MPFRRESPQPSSPNSERVRRALDSLAGDEPVPSNVLTELSESERAEVAALTRTAHLTRLVLHSDLPDGNAEAKALGRAQTALHGRKASGTPLFDSPTTTSWLSGLLDRLRDSDTDRR